MITREIIRSVSPAFDQNEGMPFDRERATQITTEALQQLVEAQRTKMQLHEAVIIAYELSDLWFFAKQQYQGPTPLIDIQDAQYQEFYNSHRLLHEYLFSAPDRKEFLRRCNWIGIKSSYGSCPFYQSGQSAYLPTEYFREIGKQTKYKR